MPAAAITFTAVNKWFGKLHVLRDIDLSIAAGEVVGGVRAVGLREEHAHPLRSTPLERIQQGEIHPRALGQTIHPPARRQPARSCARAWGWCSSSSTSSPT